MQKSPVVFIVTNTSWNALNFRSSLIIALQKWGAKVYVIAPPDSSVCDLKRMGVETISLDLSSYGQKALRLPMVTVQLAVLIRKIKPTYCFSFTIIPNLVCLFASFIYPSLVVVPNIAGLGRSFNGGFLSVVATILYRIGFLRAQKIFTQNSQDAEFLIGNKVAPEHKVQALPGSGVDLDLFKPSLGSKNLKRVNFILACRLLGAKGVREYVKASAILAKSYEVNCYLAGIILPHDSDGISAEEIETWERHGAVKFLGEVRGMSDLLQSMDCAVLPTSYNEGVPRFLIEASACGLPLITTERAGCTDIAIHNKNAMFCKPADHLNLHAQMEKMILLGGDKRRVMGEFGRDRAEKMFSDELVIKPYLRLMALSQDTRQ